MSGIDYLFLQTLPIVSAVALIFCLMGLFFGAAKYRNQLKENEQAREQLSTELAELRDGQQAMGLELDDARKKLSALQSGGPVAAKGKAKAKAKRKAKGNQKPSPLPPAQSAASLEGGTTSGQLASEGSDSPTELGEIYKSAPEQTDDLKKVRGIARVMEQKLNAEGIYTFEQIAKWSDDAAVEFGKRLGVIGNVDRYNWRNQCASFHREKYGEEIS